MTLQDELKRLKEEQAQVEEQENQEEEQEEQEEVAEDEKEEKPEAEAEKGDEEEEEKPADKEEEKEDLDNSGFAKLRREAAAERKRAELLQKELEDLRSTSSEPKEDSDTKEPEQYAPEVAAVIEEQRFNQAKREFTSLEEKVQQSYKDYNDVAGQYASAMYSSLRVQNPRKSESELAEMTHRTILAKAGEYARAGYENPVEELYHEAKSLGFVAQPEKKEVEEEEDIKPDMAKVGQNRKRSAGTAAGSGNSQGSLTAKAATDLTVAEWARLPKSEKQRILNGG
jgi:chromosome segregation ATPase